MTLKKIILFVVFGISVISLKAQEVPVHEQYIFDYMLVNPCFTGIAESSVIKLAHREQWTGIKDSPRTSFLLMRHRLKDQNLGIGGYIFTDSNGPNSHHGLQLSGSYHLLLKSKRTNKLILSFGISLRGEFHILDESNFESDIYDPVIKYSSVSSFLPNANAGILLSTTSLFIGYAVDNLIPYTDKLYNDSYEPRRYFLHNFHFGKIWNVGRDGQVRPSLTFKTNLHGQNQADFSFRYYFLFDKKVKSTFVKHSNEFWVGILYKQTMDKQHFSPLSVSPAFGFTFNKFTLSYLYDFGLTRIQTRNFGTHQISIGIKFLHNYYSTWNKFDIPYFESDF
ncbi:MAG: type IX secretion system membrane protein PorP/SprF [Bacteroidales bacterium]|jgi:type IX secretion system PorP/SprF family membrane protein|nr:type IX secretion system membrane protein PorP/SprF [Bacteroidales bacterium]